ncbi:hypothetical protein [Tersicoccus sp. Bi-70]|uniref:hypothetical protein n=1 Tax=Tersicoccus sp. Bi-70 TaxID=1897634 RepID=UPI00117F7FA4|nr:hypothetical protein [Tersicoccus sp. Bi-70]
MSDSLGPMKLDFSSFYKFVASVGLILLASSVVLPWFVLRTSVPDAPAGTAAAKIVDVAVDERADQYLLIIHTYPWASLVLFVLGCVLTIYGLTAWRGRQKKQDADEDESYRQRRELGKTTQASEGDREKKLDRETREEDGLVREPAAEENLTSPTSELRQTAPTVSPPKIAEPYSARRAFIRDAELKVGQLLGAAFADSHQVEQGVRVGDSDAPILDIIARAADPSRWSSFALELKLFSARTLSMRLRESMLAVAIAARDVPEGQIQVQRVGRPPRAKSVSLCLVIIEDEEEGAELQLASSQLFLEKYEVRLGRMVRVVNTVLSRQVGVIVIPRSRFADMSADWLRQSVLNVMQEPEGVVMRMN